MVNVDTPVLHVVPLPCNHTHPGYPMLSPTVAIIHSLPGESLSTLY